MPIDPLDLLGTTIADKYEVQAVVGAGGFAVVYRARHVVLNRLVAIKAFRAFVEVDESKRERLLEMFLQEGKLLADLSERTAGICQGRDAGTLITSRGEWVPYLVLEWLEGVTLEKLLVDERAQGVPPRGLEDAIRLLEPVADALALAHRRGIAHRDVKPANVFVVSGARPGEDTIVKLLDFGIAKVVQDAESMVGGFRRTLGEATSFTPLYGAPEQFSRSLGSTGPWTDVFALALVLTEIVAGREPLDGTDFREVAQNALDCQRRPTPRTLGAPVSDAVDAVFAKALAVDVEARYPHVPDFWSALYAAAGFSQTLRGTASHPRIAVPGFLAPPSIGGLPASGTLPGAPRGTNPAGPRVTAPVPLAPAHAISPPARAGLAVAAAVVTALGIGGAIVAVRLARRAPPVASPAASSVPAVVTAPPPPLAPAPACPDDMVEIPGGKFFMGSDDPDDLPFERPAHNVQLARFCIDRREVTTAQYRGCSDVGECKRAGTTNAWDGITAAEQRAFDPLCNARDADRGQHPVNCVTWEMADAFCKARQKRLPTEAEWEFAARGPDGRKFPWGDDPPSAAFLNACGKECVAWGKKNGVDETAMYKDDDGFATTAPVGSFPKGASRYGVDDVVGNVWEWVADWYAPYGDAPSADPKGPAQGDERVIRGGAWNGSYPAWVRPTFRYHDLPTKRSYGIGFRCAKEAR